MIQAVLFDMDGLLTDSERVAMRVDAETYKQLGYHELTMETALQTLGTTREETTRLYLSLCPRFDPEAYYPLFDKALSQAMLQKQVPAKKGAVHLLEYLQERKIPYALCTSSSMERAKLTLESAGLLSWFTVFATGDKVQHSKPAPDLFLLGADMLHVRPENCLVLEDSINGIKAGMNAGMRVYMVPDLIPYREELSPYCHAVCLDLDEVARKIAMEE